MQLSLTKLFKSAKKSGIDFQSILPVTVFTLVAFFLRFFHLGWHSLWYDEALNVWDSSHSFSEIHKVIQASPPLYHYIVRCVYLFSGNDDFWLRIPSAFFGTITIPFAYYAIKKLFGLQSAFWGTLLWVFSPYHVAYSHELRMYSLLALLSLGSVVFWINVMKANKRQDWILYTLCSLVGLYTHNWFVFLIFSQGLIYLWVNQFRLTKYAAVSFIILGLLYLPWFVYLRTQLNRDQFDFLVAPWWYHLKVTAEAFAGTRVPSGHSFLLVEGWARIGIWSIFVFWLTMILIRQKGPPIVGRIFWGSFILTLAVPFFISIFYRPIYHGARYTILVLPSFLIILSSIFQGSGRIQKTAKSLAVICVLLWVMPLKTFLTNYEKAPWKKSAMWLSENLKQGHQVTLAGLPDTDGLVLHYYLPKETLSPEFVTPADRKVLLMPVRAYELNEKIKMIPPGLKILKVLDQGQLSVVVLINPHG